MRRESVYEEACITEDCEATNPKRSVHTVPLPLLGAWESILGLDAVQHGFVETAPAGPSQLSNMLRYVNHDLLQDPTNSKSPPHPGASCPLCFDMWDAPLRAPTANTGNATLPVFVRVVCGHWIHYKCLITAATKMDYHSNKCAQCGTRLFEWEGITALTLATRHEITMANYSHDGVLQAPSHLCKGTDQAEYEHECEEIESNIEAQIVVALKQQSTYPDRSPDMVRCFLEILNVLQRMQKPNARWMQYSTSTGFSLYALLVFIKLRGQLTMGHLHVVGTMGWAEFETAGRLLSERIWAEVNAV